MTVLVSAAIALPAVSARRTLIRAPTSAALLGDGLIGLVDLFHLLLSQIGQGIVLIIVRMVLPGELTVCLFDLFIAGIGADPQNTVRIVHVGFLQIFSFFRRDQLPSKTACWIMGSPK